MTDPLADFLLARIAEDEAVARAAAEDDGSWQVSDYGYEEFGQTVGPASPHGGVYRNVVTDQPFAAYIARHDPARVLAECEAKRRIVEWCSERTRVFVGRLCDDPTDPANYVPGDYAHQDETPVLRLLALPYAEHPDYRKEWTS